jgi:hypothetical protein
VEIEVVHPLHIRLRKSVQIIPSTPYLYIPVIDINVSLRVPGSKQYRYLVSIHQFYPDEKTSLQYLPNQD